MQSFQSPVGVNRAELIVKKSRFIAYGFKATSRDEAMSQLDGLRDKYPDARHHCWAYLLGSPHAPKSVAMSDDGEPSGTAGKPILNVLQHKSVGDILVVVVRYFGGIKLGAGGLVRAYSGATQNLYDQLVTEEQVPQDLLVLQCSFEEEQRIRHFLAQYQGNVEHCSYSAHVSMTVQLPTQHAEAFKQVLNGFKDTQLKDDPKPI